MSTPTTNMAMGKAVDGDNAKTYLETTLGSALDKLDAHQHYGTTSGLAFTTQSNVMGTDVAVNNTASYFDGPNVAQGTVGTWFAYGQVTIVAVAADDVIVRLWDGTTNVATTILKIGTGYTSTCVTLSGIIANPAANLRMSVRNSTSISGKIAFNNSGLSKDSSIFAVRIG